MLVSISFLANMLFRKSKGITALKNVCVCLVNVMHNKNDKMGIQIYM